MGKDEKDGKTILAEMMAMHKDERADVTAKEQYLNGIASRLSELKMDGTRPSYDRLIGENLSKGAEMFALKEFSPKAQAEILLNLAYYRSEAFQERLIHSMGYDSFAEMTEEDRQLYVSTVERGREAYKNIRFEPVNETMSSYMAVDKENKETVAKFPRNPETGNEAIDSVNVISHEMGHYIYHVTEGTINPDDKWYSREDTPYGQLSRKELDKEKFLDRSLMVWDSEDYRQALKHELGQLSGLDQEELDDRLEYVSNSSKEELLQNKDFMEGAMEHDDMGIEKAADIRGAQMLMLREGIWNPFAKEPLTEQQMRAFEQRYPYSRIFQWLDAKEATYFLNNIAMNDEEMKTPEETRRQLNALAKEGLKTQSSERPLAAHDALKMSAADLTAMNYETMAEKLDTELQQNRSQGMRL